MVFAIAAEELSALQALAARANVGCAHAFLVALSCCVARCAGRNEVVFGLPVHNRATAARRKMVGMFAGIVLCLLVAARYR